MRRPVTHEPKLIAILMEKFFQDIFWSDDGDYAQEQRNILRYNHGNGKLYGVTDAGRVRISDARDGLVTQTYFRKHTECLDSTEEGVDENRCRVKEFNISPELDITVEYFVMNRSGTVGLVAGTRMSDAEVCGAVILHLARPGGRQGTEIPARLLDEKFFSLHPGLRVVHMEWHPDSEVHVLVLTSDHTLRLYNIEEPNFAEQTFELRMQRLRFNIYEEEEELWNEAVPVSFAFGKGKGWNRVSIIVLMSDGDLRVLCPVAPFGARYPGRWLLTLFEDFKEDKSKKMSKESLLWIYKAFSIDDVADINEESVYMVVPHALESHVPRLSPALNVASNSKKDTIAFRAVSCHVWMMSSVLGAVLASDSGMIRAGVVSNKLEPAWSLNPPQCIFQGSDIRAVRSQCVEQKLLESSCSQSAVFIVIDDVILPSGTRKNVSAVDLGISNLMIRGVDIFRDSANPLRFVIAQQLNAYAVTFPWISSITEYLSSDHIPDKTPQLPDVLPLPKVSEVLKIAEGDSPVVSYALLGDKLSGTALLGIQSNGSYALKKVATSNIASKDHLKEEDDFLQQSKQKLLDHVHEMYDPITTVPTMARRHPFDTTAPADTPENFKSFVESIGDLRSNHVAYCHKAGHTIVKRIDYLKSEVAKQMDMVQDVSRILELTKKKQDSLKLRHDKAQWMNSNIEDRVKLLAELHWAAPRPQSEAEKQFQHHELPLLESSAAALAQEVEMIQSQATAIKNAKRLSKVEESEQTNIQPHALRRLREILSEHDSLIRESSMKLHQIDQFLCRTKSPHP